MQMKQQKLSIWFGFFLSLVGAIFINLFVSFQSPDVINYYICFSQEALWENWTFYIYYLFGFKLIEAVVHWIQFIDWLYNSHFGNFSCVAAVKLASILFFSFWRQFCWNYAAWGKEEVREGKEEQ